MSTDKNNLVYQEQLDDNVIEMLSEDIGSNYSLRTENTKTIVAALNEILGKDIICNAVGSPLMTTDTFDVMGEKINGLTSDFKAKLLGLGVSISSVDKLESLISKLDGIDLGADAEELLSPFIDTLSGILADEGVILNGNETLGELIIKVDERFNELHNEIDSLEAEVDNLEIELAGKVTPAGTAVASDVLSGKTFINSTGQTITGTMVNRGGAQTVTPGTSNKTLNSGYYSGNITVKGDSNLKPENIVSGKSIFGVSGTAASLPSGSNIIYNSGTINTDVTGGFTHQVYNSTSVSSVLTYYSDSISLTSVSNTVCPTACSLRSNYPINTYQYNKLRITYKIRASDDNYYYFQVGLGRLTANSDKMGDYSLSYIARDYLYGIGILDYTDVKTLDIDISNISDPCYLVITGHQEKSYTSNLHLYIYKIELI